MDPEPKCVDVTAAILVRDGRLVIARRKPGKKLAGKWEFVGGKLEAGEGPEDGLRRELREELGIEALIGRFFGESIYEYHHLKIRLLAYVAYCGQETLQLKDHDAVRLVGIRELAGYDFAPADIPLVRQLEEEGLEGLTQVDP